MLKPQHMVPVSLLLLFHHGRCSRFQTESDPENGSWSAQTAIREEPGQSRAELLDAEPDSPWTKARICSYCSLAWLSFTRSILFWRIRMCFSFMISMAARCSEVWGWGHDSFPAGQADRSSSVYSRTTGGEGPTGSESDLPMSRRAASMTAAPFNMVAIRMSWPGQSTNDTCL